MSIEVIGAGEGRIAEREREIERDERCEKGSKVKEWYLL